MNHYLNAIKYKYAQFEGRARREEYWMFQLFHFLFSLSAYILDFTLVFLSDGIYFFPFITLIYFGSIFIPALAVYVRRLHDTGKSGWLILISIIPFCGIILFVFSVLEGDHGTNEYGKDPKAIDDVYYK